MITHYNTTQYNDNNILYKHIFLTTPFFGSEDLQMISSIYVLLQYLLYAPKGKKVTIMQNNP